MVRRGWIVADALIVIPAVQLAAIVVLEGGIEFFEEVVDCDDGLIGQFGEGEGIEVVAHVSEPLGLFAEDAWSRAEQRPVDRVSRRAR